MSDKREDPVLAYSNVHGGSTVPVPAVTGANKMATPPRPVVDEDDCE